MEAKDAHTASLWYVEVDLNIDTYLHTWQFVNQFTAINDYPPGSVVMQICVIAKSSSNGCLGIRRDPLPNVQSVFSEEKSCTMYLQLEGPHTYSVHGITFTAILRPWRQVISFHAYL